MRPIFGSEKYSCCTSVPGPATLLKIKLGKENNNLLSSRLVGPSPPPPPPLPARPLMTFFYFQTVFEKLSSSLPSTFSNFHCLFTYLDLSIIFNFVCSHFFYGAVFFSALTFFWFIGLLDADHRFRLRGGVCLQQTDLSDQTKSDSSSSSSDRFGGDDGTQQKGTTVTPLSASAKSSNNRSFVVSMFGTKDDIKAHYKAANATVCGATWKAFFGYSGASAEDLWGGVGEKDRKLWSVS